ncbi:MAG: DUF4870 domain-containing protein [Deltaproteobacteria bacterium]|uniref:DUF4870 domain-containing protein n=1 Tax=Candidatus Zymogenus saltonus TaxID=2844893 RepID=A0A9D8KC52_9DELT|nr:DUF4870 domain-containing protein [Candidatus Zymogenus saltonus]
MAESEDVKGIGPGGEDGEPKGKKKIEEPKGESNGAKRIAGSNDDVKKGGEAEISSDDKLFSVISHLSGLLMYLVPPFQIAVPLIIWLIKSEENAYIRHHARQSTFFQILIIAAYLISGLLCFVLIGFLLLPVVAVFHIVYTILASIAANRGELYVYPYMDRILKKLNIKID